MSNRSCCAGKVGFAVGTGRCGSSFLFEALAAEPHVAAHHDRNVVNESFHRYCKWYKLPVDHEGFLQTKEGEIKEDLARADYSFEASPQLSLSIAQLYQRFEAKFVLLVRRPENVVNSHLAKGWYCDPLVIEDPNLAPGYQSNVEYIHRFFGRIVPRGEEYLHWREMSRVGKLAWYWNALNARVLEQFEELPAGHTRVVRLEDFDYETYLDVLRFLGIESNLTQERYSSLAERRPNKGANVPTILTWSPSEMDEFEREAAPMAEHFGYPCKREHLPRPQVRYRNAASRSLTSRLWRRVKRVAQAAL